MGLRTATSQGSRGRWPRPVAGTGSGEGAREARGAAGRRRSRNKRGGRERGLGVRADVLSAGAEVPQCDDARAARFELQCSAFTPGLSQGRGHPRLSAKCAAYAYGPAGWAVRPEVPVGDRIRSREPATGTSRGFPGIGASDVFRPVTPHRGVASKYMAKDAARATWPRVCCSAAPTLHDPNFEHSVVLLGPRRR